MEKTSGQKLVNSITNDIMGSTRIVEFSSLSLSEPFMQHEPKTATQLRIKLGIIEAKKQGIKDFRRPLFDPSVDENGNIFFKKGENPGTGYSGLWWIENAKKICPEKNSRISSDLEYFAFMGTIIKSLVENHKYTISEAWAAVCDDSKNLGNYYSFEKKLAKFENTGSFPFDGWYDLANTCKIICIHDSTNIVVASGYFCFYSYFYTLAHFMTHIHSEDNLHTSVGSIVFDV